MMRLCFVICSLILLQCVCAQFIKIQPPQENVNKKSNNNARTIPLEEKHIILLKDDTELEKHTATQVKSDPHKVNAAVNNTAEPAHQQKKQSDVQPQNDTDESSIPNVGVSHFQKDSMQYGPLLRGFYVFVSLSALVLIYFVFRSYRIRRNRQSSVKVKKYGVVTRRNDIEMRRLELEEEDDENLFDIEQHRTNK
ncbi:uncharacterized protein LOC108734421 [Agrilus planipennis]|uniref:Uncharacterized protein LOC108734421 n=1 Tax=Agrilus planipennis TaxID=224129 RepID=A0A1W4WBX3_AGRPL|nr:uncharacterized protein LOC108734421 [Agrilus planipennis]